jgi:hypothetical protein
VAALGRSGAVSNRDDAVGLLGEPEQERLAGIHDGPLFGDIDYDRCGDNLHDRCGGDLHDRCGGNLHGLHLWKLDGDLAPVVGGHHLDHSP